MVMVELLLWNCCFMFSVNIDDRTLKSQQVQVCHYEYIVRDITPVPFSSGSFYIATCIEYFTFDYSSSTEIRNKERLLLSIVISDSVQ